MAENMLNEKKEKLQDSIETIEEEFIEAEQTLEEIREFKQDLEKHVDIQASNIDFDRLAKFVSEKYWLINEKDGNEYEVWVPRFMDVQVGVLDRKVGGYNVFRLDNTTKMISGIPEFLQDEVDLDDEQKFKVKGDLIEFDTEQRERVEEELGDHVEDVEEDKATIKEDHGYQVVRELLDKGEMPFTPTPVDESDLRDTETLHDLRPYQEDAYQEWLEHGALTVCFMTGAGKSHVGIEALDSLKYDEKTGRKAIVVWTKITEKQWEEYIEEFAPRLAEEIEIYTYHSLHKLEERINQGYEYSMILFDECDYLPAETFSRASTYPTKYRMGLSASPIRSDGAENEVFALCGKPTGMDWKKTADLIGKELHEVNLHTVRDREEKIDRVQELLDEDKRTMIFVDALQMGEDIKEASGIPFVSGQDSKQLEKINDAMEKHNAVIVSRIADRGLSIEGLENIIEADFIGDSRRQQIQRTGRLLHGEGESHDIVMTGGEVNSNQSRLYGLIEKGFKINDVDDALDVNLDEKFEARVDFDIEEQMTSEDVVEAPEPASSPRVGEADSKIEFLKHDKIQEIVQEAVDEGYLPNDDLRKAILAIASSENGLTNQEIAEEVGKPDRSNKNKFSKPFRERNLVKKVDDRGAYDLNVENMQSIIEDYQERKSRKKEIEELEEEIF